MNSVAVEIISKEITPSNFDYRSGSSSIRIWSSSLACIIDDSSCPASTVGQAGHISSTNLFFQCLKNPTRLYPREPPWISSSNSDVSRRILRLNARSICTSVMIATNLQLDLYMAERWLSRTDSSLLRRRCFRFTQCF